MRLILLDGPVNEPLTAAEVRARSNIGSEISDAVIDAYIIASRQMIDGADGYLGRALITQTWQGNIDQFPSSSCDSGRIYIPLPPLQQLVELSYLDANGIPTVVAEGNYQVVMGPRPYIVPVYNSAWPSVTTRADAISIKFTAGYGDDGDDVPEPIRTAISLGVANLRSMSSRNLTVSLEQEEGIGETRYIINKDVLGAMDETMRCLLSIYRVIWL